MSADKLLDRLEGVRSTGAGRWIARCPAHEDRSPSLSIREDDGRWLLHCFAGCDVQQVLDAVGLEFGDLFPPRDPAVHSRRGTHRPWTAAQMLALTEREMRVATVIVSDVVQRGTATGEELQRLAQASGRLGLLVDAL